VTIVTIISDDLILAFNDAARRGLLGAGAVTARHLSPQFPIEPPYAQSDGSREHRDDAAQHHERNETQDHRNTDYQGTNENHEQIRDRISRRYPSIARRILQINSLTPAYSAGLRV